MTVTVQRTNTIDALLNNEMKKQENGAVLVHVRLMFLRVGAVETHRERYEAHLAVESHWPADAALIATLTSTQKETLDQDRHLSLVGEYKGWQPRIFILNRDAGSLEETVHYSLKLHHETQQIEACELRIYEGRFLCDFDLHHYPTDTQNLNVSIGSNLPDKKVRLEADSRNLSGVNKESFAAQHEWILYEHVETTPSWVKGYVFRHDQHGGGDLYAPAQPKIRGTLNVTCHVARKSHYFYWNHFLIVFLFSGIGFSSFAVTVDLTPQRLGIVSNLLLSQIAFRWTISVSHILPHISYMTVFDKYSLACMFVLAIFGIWHSIIGALIFSLNNFEKITPNSSWFWIDRYFLIGLVSAFLIAHVLFIAWHYCVPLHQRREMRKKDNEYRKVLAKKMLLKTSQPVLTNGSCDHAVEMQ